MPFNIHVVTVPDFLRTTGDGMYDLDSTAKALTKIALECLKSDLHHVLLDVRQSTSTLTATEIYQLAVTLGDTGFDHRDKIAILNQPKDDFDRAYFFETVASNRGYRVRAFRDFEKAFDWLNSD